MTSDQVNTLTALVGNTWPSHLLAHAARAIRLRTILNL